VLKTPDPKGHEYCRTRSAREWTVPGISSRHSSPGLTHNRRFPIRSTIARYSHFCKKRRIASIEASRILSWPPRRLLTLERDTPSSREIRAFFHSDRSANVRNRLNISAFSRSLCAFSAVSIALVNGDERDRFFKLRRYANKLTSFLVNQTGPVATAMASSIEELERVAKVIRVLA
jgi:hypothetical protein